MYLSPGNIKHNDLRRIPDPQRQYALAGASAHYHGSDTGSEFAGVIFRKEPLTRRVYSSGAREPELSSVRMTGEYKVKPGRNIFFKSFGPVGKKNAVPVPVRSYF